MVDLREITAVQSWAFFGGCHKQLRGWHTHTIFRNHHTANVSGDRKLRDSGINGDIMVVLCGPFMTTQKAMLILLL